MVESAPFIVQFLAVFFQDLLSGLFNLIFFWMKKPKNISGQLALVTGGARGLGRSIAFRLAMEGCNVAVCDINIEEATRTSREIREKWNVSCEAFKVDVSNTEHVNSLHDEIVKKMGSVDILVNNAGVLAPLAALEGADKDVIRILNINLMSHFWMVRRFLPTMIKQKRGHILGVSSLAAKVTIPFSAYYCASKSGVNGFYGSLYDDLCLRDYDEFINISVACPGFINTRADLSELLEKTANMPLMDPEGAAEEIVRAILFNKREVIFPFSYKLGYYMDHIYTRRVKKLFKTITSRSGLDLEDFRMKVTQK